MINHNLPSLTIIDQYSSNHQYITVYIWVNYNNSLTWIKAIWRWFPLLTMIPVRSQWGRYNLPIYIYIIFLLGSTYFLGHWRPGFVSGKTTKGWLPTRMAIGNDRFTCRYHCRNQPDYSLPDFFGKPSWINSLVLLPNDFLSTLLFEALKRSWTQLNHHSKKKVDSQPFSIPKNSSEKIMENYNFKKTMSN